MTTTETTTTEVEAIEDPSLLITLLENIAVQDAIIAVVALGVGALVARLPDVFRTIFVRTVDKIDEDLDSKK